MPGIYDEQVLLPLPHEKEDIVCSGYSPMSRIESRPTTYWKKSICMLIKATFAGLMHAFSFLYHYLSCRLRSNDSYTS